MWPDHTKYSITKRVNSVLFTTASTLTCAQRRSSTHHGCRNPPRRKRDSAQIRSRQSRSWARQWRRWMGLGTPGACRCSLAAAKNRCCRCCLLKFPAAWPAAGPRHAEAYSPGGGSATPRPPLGQIPDKWTQKCERRAYTGCSRRRNARRPLGLPSQLLEGRRDGNRLWLTTVKLAKRQLSLLCGHWLVGPTTHMYACSRSQFWY